ncbi:MAG: TA system VapC family ribonuclease toxin [Myxococcaceae bacterium]
MIAFDTNVLVYAHRRDSPFFAEASEAVRRCAEGKDAWAMLWPCVHEFLAVVTNPKIFKTPTPMPVAVGQVEQWLSSPTVVLVNEEAGYWSHFSELCVGAKISGAKVHDARVAALARFHELELLSADRDFTRFPGLDVRNPLHPRR